MSVTYPADPTKPYGDRLESPRVDPHAELAREEPFVPVYARSGKARAGQSKIRTWMILVPVGAIVLGGIGAMLVMGGGEEASAPLAEPAATAPVLSTLPAPVVTGTATAPLTSASTPAPVVTAPPAVRETAPLRRATPAPAPRREAAPASAATPRVVNPAPAPAVGPQPYTPTAPSTSTLNTAPAARATTPAPAPTPRPPIVVQPLG